MNSFHLNWVLMSCLLVDVTMMPVFAMNIMMEKLLDFVFSQPFFSKQLSKIVSSNEAQRKIVFSRLLMYLLMAYSAYFQIGNTNSLSTVSVMPCFIGLNSYVPALCSINMVTAIYCTFVLWIIKFFIWLQQDLFACKFNDLLPSHYYRESLANSQEASNGAFLRKSQHVDALVVSFRNRIVLNYYTFHSIISVITIVQCASLTVNMMVSFILRDHLFIWSVICPKFLYEYCRSVLVFVVSILVSILFTFDNTFMLNVYS